MTVTPPQASGASTWECPDPPSKCGENAWGATVANRVQGRVPGGGATASLGSRPIANANDGNRTMQGGNIYIFDRRARMPGAGSRRVRSSRLHLPSAPANSLGQPMLPRIIRQHGSRHLPQSRQRARRQEVNSLRNWYPTIRARSLTAIFIADISESISS